MVPNGHNVRPQLNQLIGVFTAQANVAHWPVHDPRLNRWIGREIKFLLDLRLHHWENVAAALVVFMGQHRAPHNWQIGVAAHKIVGELPLNFHQVDQGLLINFHRFVLGV